MNIIAQIVNHFDINTFISVGLPSLIILLFNLYDRSKKKQIDGQIAIIQAQAQAAANSASAAAKTAAATRNEVSASRIERHDQYTDLKQVSVEATNTANGHNAKIASLSEEMRGQREIIAKLQDTVNNMSRLKKSE